MQNYDFKKFSESWLMAHEITAAGRTISKPAMVMIFEALEDCPLDMVLAALKIHIKKNNFAPTVCGIRETVAEMSGNKHLGADEAWNIAILAFDETSSVVWTQEMCEAKAAAQPSWDLGDKIGARMAFRECYNRKINNAGPVKWVVSGGYDKSQTAQVVNDAIAMNRLPPGSDSKYIKIECTTTTTKLIEDANRRSGKELALGNIQIVKKMLFEQAKTESVADGIARREKDREDINLKLESRKSDIITDILPLLSESELEDLFPF